MKRHIKNHVYWIGKSDWELAKFHGEEYSTHRGSTYNAYLIQEEKTVLIDTVWAPFADEYVDNLAGEIDLESIDYIVANHAEIDHSGALPKISSMIWWIKTNSTARRRSITPTSSRRSVRW